VSARADAVVIPLDVAAQWLAWLDASQAERVGADLRRVLADARAPDPPSSVDRPISTR
jgi:hypothetical protein